MDEVFDFNSLVGLCRETHQTMRLRAARSINVELVVRNWLFGWYLVEYEQKGADQAEYGAGLLEKLSKELGKGFSIRSLRQFRQFYLHQKEIRQTLPAETVESCNGRDDSMLRIRQTVSAKSFPIRPTLPGEWIHDLIPQLARYFKLGWSHYVSLLTIDNPEERRFYEIEAAANSWSVRELEWQIGSSLFERLVLSRNKEEVSQLAKEGLVVEKAADLIKNPLVLEFLELEERPAYSEEELEEAIIDKLEQFLLELGKGFLFEARQKRFTFDNDHFYVDLVFYNRLLRCYVLIDLKLDKLTHKDLGQMQMYVNHFDRHVKTTDEQPTIGMVLCHRKNDALVELTLPKDANIFASKYQLYLPSKEELKEQLESIAEELERDNSA